MHLLFIIFGNNISKWLEPHLLACPIKQITKIDCPGCGFQRSIIALLNGDLVQSLKFYPATPLIILLLVFLSLHLSVKLKFGASIIKILYIAVSIVIIGNYIHKIFTHQLI